MTLKKMKALIIYAISVVIITTISSTVLISNWGHGGGGAIGLSEKMGIFGTVFSLGFQTAIYGLIIVGIYYGISDLIKKWKKDPK